MNWKKYSNSREKSTGEVQQENWQKKEAVNLKALTEDPHYNIQETRKHHTSKENSHKGSHMLWLPVHKVPVHKVSRVGQSTGQKKLSPWLLRAGRQEWEEMLVGLGSALRVKTMLWDQVVMSTTQACKYTTNHELYTLKGWILWDMNYISIQVL